MCEFFSWIEHEGKNYYINNDCLKDGRLEKHLGKYFKNEVIGHGVIDFYFNLKGVGIHKEINNFDSLYMLPKEMVQDLKNMNFTQVVGFIPDVLTDEAKKEYNEIVSKAWEEYNEIVSKARKEYDEIESKAYKEYDEIASKSFWNLFKVPNNRIEIWR